MNSDSGTDVVGSEENVDSEEYDAQIAENNPDWNPGNKIPSFIDPLTSCSKLRCPKVQRQVDRDSDEPHIKKTKTVVDLSVPGERFKDFRGFPQVLKIISEFVLHMKEGSVYKALGVTPPRGLLICGPPGSGKTLLAKAIAGELDVPLISTTGADLSPSMFAPCDNIIRGIFCLARQQSPCIVFIDNIECAVLKKELANKLEQKVSAALIAAIQALNAGESNNRIIIIGATTSSDLVDPEFRRAGRFDKEIRLEMPDRDARLDILQYFTSGMKLHEEVSLDEIAEVTPGFVAADLRALVTEAAVVAVTKVIRTKLKESNDINAENIDDYLRYLKSENSLLTNDEVNNLSVETDDFLQALKSTKPSSKREGFVSVPNVTWDDVGSLQEIRKELKSSILFPVKHPKDFSMLGITRPTGILLCGPPGCGKTLLAKAIANEANINFISVKGPELLSSYVGASEKAVRECFQKAKNAQPCVIFFDEIDSLCPKRGLVSEGNACLARVLNQLLTEMDGFEERQGVFILAATNRPDILDPAVLRPGRFDKILFVGLPSASDRVDILRALTKDGSKPPMPNVDLEEIGKKSLLDGYTGADLASLVKEATVQALTEFMEGKSSSVEVTSQMLLDAASKLRPSVSDQDMKFYTKLKAQYGSRGDSKSA